MAKLSEIQQNVDFLSPNSKPASMTNSLLTSTGRGRNFDPRASELERAARQSSGASFRRFGSPRAWDSRVTFVNGRAFCGSGIDLHAPHHPLENITMSSYYALSAAASC